MLKLDPPPPASTQDFTDDDLVNALQILAAECYGAMKVCNMLGGVRTKEWELLHNNKWAELVAEGQARNLPFDTMKCAVSGTPFLWSATIRFALGQIDDATRQQQFRKYVKNGEGVWPDPATIT